MKVFLFLLFLVPSIAFADKNTDYINTIPDLLQTDSHANFGPGGKMYCGPVAVSNSLVWLEGVSSLRYQIDLAKQLATSQYMNTEGRDGTPTQNLIAGIDKYVREKWGNYRSLKYQGLWMPSAKYATTQRVPQLDWLKQGISRKGGVWINVGWYRQDPNSNTFHRYGGHWVTLVGYDFIGRTVLVIHDPAPRSGKKFQNHFVHLEKMNGGTIQVDRRQKPWAAKGLFIMGEGMQKMRKGDCAILEGAVRLML